MSSIACSTAATAPQYVRMQPRFLFAKGGSVHPRSSTKLVKPRGCTGFSEREIKVRHVPSTWHRNSIQNVSNVRRVNTGLKHWHMFRGSELGLVTTVETAVQEDLAVIQDIRETTLPPDTILISHNKSTSAKPPVTESRSGFQFVRTKGYTPGIAHSDVEGRMTHISRRSLRNRYRSINPLAAWLNTEKRSRRAAIWAAAVKNHLNGSEKLSLPTILLCYLEGTETPVAGGVSLAGTLAMSALPTLQRSGFSPEDVQLWAHILTAPTDEEVARRFLSCQSRKPTFILLEVLRRPRLSVGSFRSLLVHSYHLIGIATNELRSESESKAGDVVPAGQVVPLTVVLSSRPYYVNSLEHTTFDVMVDRLLRHARRVWPPAIISISNMVVSYCQHVFGDEVDTPPKLYTRLCQVYNKMLCSLSLPASNNPMKCMTYNWQAQRIFLTSATQYRPPLQLAKSTYRAVSQVLVASQKTPQEKHFASLMRRTWPPWRKELDGMDCARSADEDTSRVFAALSRMKEAGYAEDAIDRALKILGGREPDGTPAIQTRQLTTIELRHLVGTRHARFQQSSGDITVESAARITATRDVYEAWEAFQSCTRGGRRPSHSMYHAMFEKLIYNTMTYDQHQDEEPLPGDSKEVLPVMDDNSSESERLRMQPPRLKVLFSRMIEDGIRPSGLCLEMLISNAPSLAKVALYMHHATLPSSTFIELLRVPMAMRFSALKSIPDGIFAAFIRFLCRSRYGRIPDTSNNLIRGTSVARFKRKSDLVLHALELVRRRQTSSRVVWYMIFRVLARRELVMDESRSQNSNDIKSWRLLEAALGESIKAGVQLDSDGFRHICIGLEKVLAIHSDLGKSVSLVRNGAKLVKEMFANLSESAEAKHGLPRLLHTFTGYHLHPYIRVLGHLYDSDEILGVLQWMVKHQEELSNASKQARNGPKLFRRSLVAIRVFFGEKYAEEEEVDRLKAAIDKLVGWGGWPTDEEVEDYLTYGVPGAQNTTAVENGDLRKAESCR